MRGKGWEFEYLKEPGLIHSPILTIEPEAKVLSLF